MEKWIPWPLYRIADPNWLPDCWEYWTVTDPWPINTDDPTYNIPLCILLVVAPIPIRFLFCRWWAANKIGQKLAAKGKLLDSKTDRRIRDSCFFIIHLTLSFGTCYISCYNSDWNDPFANPKLPYYYTSYYYPAWSIGGQALPWEIKLAYNCTTSFYVYGLISLFFFEEAKGDFWLLVSHHVVTLWLIISSVFARQEAIGAVIMLLFDINDIQIELAKVSNRLGRDIFAAIFFIIFVASWFYNRIYIFGQYTLYNLNYMQILWDIPDHNMSPVPGFRICVFLSWIIYLMSLYWTWLILKKLKSLISTLLTEGIGKTIQEGDDPRGYLKPEDDDLPENKKDNNGSQKKKKDE